MNALFCNINLKEYTVEPRYINAKKIESSPLLAAIALESTRGCVILFRQKVMVTPFCIGTAAHSALKLVTASH